MSLTLHNRVKGKSPYGEKYKLPTFKIPRATWIQRLWQIIKKFLNKRIF